MARFAPKLYNRMLPQTGRGDDAESAQQAAAYFTRCLDEYGERLGMGAEALNRIKLNVSREFRRLSLAELSWLGFWMVLQHHTAD